MASQDRNCWGSSSYNVCSIWIPISTSPNASIVMKLLDSPGRGLNDSWWYMAASLDYTSEILSFSPFLPHSLSLSLSYGFSSSDTKPLFHNLLYFLGTMQITPVSQLLFLVISSTSAFLDRGCSIHPNAPRSHGCGPGITKFSLWMTFGRCLTLQVSHSERWIKKAPLFWGPVKSLLKRRGV